MERDDLQNVWASYEAQLRRYADLNNLVVSQSIANSARTSLNRERFWLAFEIVANVAGIFVLGSYAADRVHDVATCVSAAVLAATLIAANIVLAGIAVGIERLDFDEPVVAIQTALERIKLRRAALTAGLLVAGPLLWTPMSIAFVGLFTADPIAALGVPYVVANVGLGLLIAVGAWAAARRYGSRLRAARWFATLVDALSGNAYRRASDYLDTIDRFCNEA